MLCSIASGQLTCLFPGLPCEVPPPPFASEHAQEPPHGAVGHAQWSVRVGVVAHFRRRAAQPGAVAVRERPGRVCALCSSPAAPGGARTQPPGCCASAGTFAAAWNARVQPWWRAGLRRGDAAERAEGSGGEPRMLGFGKSRVAVFKASLMVSGGLTRDFFYCSVGASVGDPKCIKITSGPHQIVLKN